MPMQEKEDYEMGSFRETPSTNTRAMATDILLRCGVFYVRKTFNPSTYSVQLIKDDDYPHCLDFVRWMMHMIMKNSQFFSLILLTDDASLNREGIFNTHNEYIWAENNPHLITSRKYQRRFAINMKAGIFGGHLIGLLPATRSLTSKKYFVLLKRVQPS